MDYKNIILKEEARQLIKEGINDLAKVVLLTMGPEGSTVIIPDENGNPKITKDGVSVAKAVSFQDPIKNVGATLIKEVANKTVKEAGDGTTTSICLANAFINEGFKLLKDGETFNKLKEELVALEKGVIKLLEEQTIDVSEDDIENVATIAANNDRSIGKIIKEAYSHSKVVRVDKGNSTNHSVDLIEGMELKTGILDPAFINDPASKAISYDNARLIVIEGHLKSLKSIAHLINSLDIDTPLIIIADEVSDNVTKILKDNYNKGALKVGIIKSPGHAQHRANLLSDIKLACIPKGESMGFIKIIKATADKTIISYNRNEDVIERLSDFKKAMDITHDDYAKELLQQRIDILEGNVAVIKVGGDSELEIGEIFDRVEDAVLATRCAIEEGIIEGAGTPLLLIAASIHFNATNLFSRCLESPRRQIEDNGWTSPITLSGKPDNFYIRGVIDPVKVTRVALKNAISVAKTVLGTEAIVQ